MPMVSGYFFPHILKLRMSHHSCGYFACNCIRIISVSSSELSFTTITSYCGTLFEYGEDFSARSFHHVRKSLWKPGEDFLMVPAMNHSLQAAEK
jgi:hypothetical protein